MKSATSQKHKREKKKAKASSNQPVKPSSIKAKETNTIGFLLLILGVTAIAYIPMLSNGFTNWDDEYYVIQNELLKGPDWAGIFTEPVVSNYHPLTIITLAFNYALTGLEPSSYLILNYLLHLVNTALVFYFILSISSRNLWVSLFTALIFGIHPMHVESVAWVSERKDVLYTLFFLLALMQYWKYVNTVKSVNLWLCFLFFSLSLLSKPAAIVLPLVLLLLDYWKGRTFDRKAVLEKIPFFVLSLIFGVLTVQIQSEKAIAGLDLYSLWSRFFFATYVIMIYFVRFFIPYPLSAFHPYPAVDNLGLAIWLSPLFVLAAGWLLWKFRNNKWLIFGAGFYIVNLLLVLQVISIGATIVSERYTYMPYIGLAFLVAFLVHRYVEKQKVMQWSVALICIVGFGYISYERTKIWKDSLTLWTDVIEKYPNEAVPRTNRANYVTKMAIELGRSPEATPLYAQALEDCNIALISKPADISAFETRQNIYLNTGKDQEAFSDAETLIKLDPNNYRGYYTKGVVHTRRNEYQNAYDNLSKAIEYNAKLDAALNMRGSILVNGFQSYAQALVDFNKAIALSPQGNYYMNRAICYFKLGDLANAKLDAQMAMQNGIQLPDSFKQALGL